MGFWSGAAGRNGRGQYACDVTIDTEDWRTAGTGWELYAPCYMNGGASGGPWFVQKTDGSWTIGGVSNRCWSATNMSPTAYCQPYSDFLRASYLDSRFLAFWNAVQPQLAVR